MVVCDIREFMSLLVLVVVLCRIRVCLSFFSLFRLACVLVNRKTRKNSGVLSWLLIRINLLFVDCQRYMVVMLNLFLKKFVCCPHRIFGWVFCLLFYMCFDLLAKMLMGDGRVCNTHLFVFFFWTYFAIFIRFWLIIFMRNQGHACVTRTFVSVYEP